ncbi:MAG: alpha/beta fold hydrolase [Caulobacteraceae bacterium]
MFRVKKPTQDWADRWWRSADGLRLYAREYAGASGEARLPVICLHGLTRNSADFEAVAPFLAGLGRNVIVPDVRGRGRSDRDPHPMNYHPGTYAGDVIAMTQALGLARAAFIGTSMGALITMTLNALRPDLVGPVAINDIGPEVDPAGIARIGAYVGQPVTVRNWRDAARYSRETNGSAHPAFSDKDWETMARRTFRAGSGGKPVLDYDQDIAVPIKAAAGAPAPDLWPFYEGLVSNRKLLIVRGGNSDLLSRETVKRMRDLEPDSQFVEVPGVGHAPTLEEPAAKAALKAFLEANP